MNCLLVVACLAATSALAQPEVDAGSAPLEPPAQAQPANALRSDPDQIGFLQGKIDALEEQFLESKSTLAALAKIKLSGYVQARFAYAENSVSGVDASLAPLVRDGFSVRRGRVKVQYHGSVAALMLQIDATPSGVLLKDAEATFTEPWSGQGYLAVTLGQTKWPFGYETVQSSSEREFPERTRVVRAFFNGERDRGLKLVFNGGPVRATFGVFDGNGINNRGFIGIDNDTEKDFYGRVAVDFRWIAAGISGSGGLTYKPTDASGPGRHHERTRIGLDAQAWLDLLPFGSTAIKAEFIAGRTYQSGNVERFGATGLGWYALIVQNLGDHAQAAVRYDFFDPATGTPNGADASDPGKPLSTNQIHTVGLVAAYHFDEVLKASVSYELPLLVAGDPDATTPRQNLLTVQLQAKF